MEDDLEDDIKVKLEQIPNPWAVPSLDEFLHYCCPECDVKSKDYAQFYKHAVTNHPLAKLTLGKEIIFDDTSKGLAIKKESSNDQLEELPEPELKSEDEPEVEPEQKLKLNEQCYYCGDIYDTLTVQEHIKSQHNVKVNPHMYGRPLNYQCNECKLMFKSEDMLKLHICGTVPPSWLGVKTSDKKQCPKCDKVFINYRRLLEHHASTHTIEKKFKCDKCDFWTFTREQMDRHEASHNSPLTCDICFKSLKSIKTLNKHRREVHEGRKPASSHVDRRCDLCPFEGESVLAVRVHKEKVHPDAEPYKCDLCDFKSILKSRMRSHKSQAHKEASSMCDSCGKGFKSVSALHNHVRICNSTPTFESQIGIQGEFVCDKCGKSCTNSTSLQNHMRTIHGSTSVVNGTESREYVCDKCGKDFLTKSHLSMHIYQKHSQKFFICTLCERIFSTRSKVAEHIISDHDKNGLRSCIFCCDKCDNSFETSSALDLHLQNDHGMMCEHKCNECDKIVTSTAILTAHMMEAHNYNPMKDQSKTSFSSMTEVNAKTADKKFRCDYCGMYLKSEQTLSGHIISKHKTDTHNYKCDLCDFTTFQASRLKQHKIRTHTDWKKPKRVYECTECPRTFPAIGYMQTHLLDEHGIICKTD